MGYNFKKVAQEATSLSRIMQGREKLTTDDVAGKELTIIGFDFAPKFDSDGTPIVDANGEIDTFGVVVFSEKPDYYYNVGTVFTKVCKAWAADFEGDCDAASKALAEEGGVRVRFVRTKTKRGNQLVSCQII